MKPIRYGILAASLALAGCAGLQSASAPVSKADIAAAEVTLTSAIRLANACLNLPAGPCSQQPLRATMIADIGKAGTAFKQAQSDNNAGLPVTLTALNVAIGQISSETPAATK